MIVLLHEIKIMGDLQWGDEEHSLDKLKQQKKSTIKSKKMKEWKMNDRNIEKKFIKCRKLHSIQFILIYSKQFQW